MVFKSMEIKSRFDIPVDREVKARFLFIAVCDLLI